jgi:hypothetical protein
MDNNELELSRRRARIWSEFVSTYMVVLVTDSENFSAFCERFRERWRKGE